VAGILVIAEHFDGDLRDITGEMIGAAVPLKADIGGPLVVAVLSDDPSGLAQSANMVGVDKVLAISAPHSHFDAAHYEEVACTLAAEHGSRLILIGHTMSGMAFGPAVAARLGSGFASDVFDIKLEEGELVVTRGGYGGKVNIDLGFPGKSTVTLMLRSATFTAPEAPGQAVATPFELELLAVENQSIHLEYERAPLGDVDIGKAEFILSVGRAVQEEKNLPRFAELAERLGATLGCSRPIADSGWLPKARQVGLSGTIAANCKLYIAFGISGAVQHLAGMKHVETIIAINKDPEAPIFNVAHYGATVDIFELADALEKEFN
jgi:electron transfer flavoprotein alpha subunit